MSDILVSLWWNETQFLDHIKGQIKLEILELNFANRSWGFLHPFSLLQCWDFALMLQVWLLKFACLQQVRLPPGGEGCLNYKPLLGTARYPIRCFNKERTRCFYVILFLFFKGEVSSSLQKLIPAISQLYYYI